MNQLNIISDDQNNDFREPLIESKPNKRLWRWLRFFFFTFSVFCVVCLIFVGQYLIQEKLLSSVTHILNNATKAPHSYLTHDLPDNMKHISKHTNLDTKMFEISLPVLSILPLYAYQDIFSIIIEVNDEESLLLNIVSVKRDWMKRETELSLSDNYKLLLSNDSAVLYNSDNKILREWIYDYDLMDSLTEELSDEEKSEFNSWLFGLTSLPRFKIDVDDDLYAYRDELYSKFSDDEDLNEDPEEKEDSDKFDNEKVLEDINKNESINDKVKKAIVYESVENQIIAEPDYLALHNNKYDDDKSKSYPNEMSGYIYTDSSNEQIEQFKSLIQDNKDNLIIMDTNGEIYMSPNKAIDYALSKFFINSNDDSNTNDFYVEFENDKSNEIKQKHNISNELPNLDDDVSLSSLNKHGMPKSDNDASVVTPKEHELSKSDEDASVGTPNEDELSKLDDDASLSSLNKHELSKSDDDASVGTPNDHELSNSDDDASVGTPNEPVNVEYISDKINYPDENKHKHAIPKKPVNENSSISNYLLPSVPLIRPAVKPYLSLIGSNDLNSLAAIKLTTSGNETKSFMPYASQYKNPLMNYTDIPYEMKSAYPSLSDKSIFRPIVAKKPVYQNNSSAHKNVKSDDLSYDVVFTNNNDYKQSIDHDNKQLVDEIYNKENIGSKGNYLLDRRTPVFDGSTDYLPAYPITNKESLDSEIDSFEYFSVGSEDNIYDGDNVSQNKTKLKRNQFDNSEYMQLHQQNSPLRSEKISLDEFLFLPQYSTKYTQTTHNSNNQQTIPNNHTTQNKQYTNLNLPRNLLSEKSIKRKINNYHKIIIKFLEKAQKSGNVEVKFLTDNMYNIFLDALRTLTK